MVTKDNGLTVLLQHLVTNLHVLRLSDPWSSWDLHVFLKHEAHNLLNLRVIGSALDLSKSDLLWPLGIPHTCLVS